MRVPSERASARDSRVPTLLQAVVLLREIRLSLRQHIAHAFRQQRVLQDGAGQRFLPEHEHFQTRAGDDCR